MRHVWRRRFGIAAAIGAVAWWPLLAIFEWSPLVVALVLTVDVVLVLAFTAAWYALVDLRPQPVALIPATPDRPAADADSPGCVADALVELAGWVLFAGLAVLGSYGWREHRVATIVSAVVLTTWVVAFTALLSARQSRRDGSDC